MSRLPPLLLLLPLAAACTQPAFEPTLSNLQSELFTATCATSSCHGGIAPSRGLDLREGSSYDSLVEVAAGEDGWIRVVPGDPEASLLYVGLLEDVGDTRQMPVNYELSDGEIEAVRVWILDGAQDD